MVLMNSSVSKILNISLKEVLLCREFKGLPKGNRFLEVYLVLHCGKNKDKK